MIPRHIFEPIPDLQWSPFELWQETERIIERFDLGEHRRQICLTSPAVCSDEERLWKGVGRGTVAEDLFVHFNEEFTGTLFEDIYRRLPYRMGRVRILLLPPRAAYSLHADNERRIHIALRTTPQSMLFIHGVGDQYWRLPITANGRPYIVDTRRLHTAVNGSAETTRVHFVATLLD